MSKPAPPRAASTSAPPAAASGLSPRATLALGAAKVVVAGYWLWVLISALRPERSSFDALVVLSAPLLLSMHFVQGLFLLRVLRGRSPWWRDFVMVLFFGMVHLWPVLEGARRAARARR